jgi:hypothetical protein
VKLGIFVVIKGVSVGVEEFCRTCLKGEIPGLFSSKFEKIFKKSYLEQNKDVGYVEVQSKIYPGLPFNVKSIFVYK